MFFNCNTPKLLIGLSLMCAPFTAFAQSNVDETIFATAAPHAVILDFETGEVLYQKDASRPMAPASMTKIMTAKMVFSALKSGRLTPETEFTVSEEAWRRGGAKSGSSTMFLDLNSRVSVDNLIKGVIIQSGNDACIVLAEGMAGSEDAFAAQMTARAREMGLSSATFKNSTGWPHPEHNISAIDLAKLAKAQIKTHPEYYSLYNERNFTWNGISQGNRNPLLGKFTGADGLKTGHTEVSGYGLVGSAERNGVRRIIVINGLDSSAQRRDVSLSLMNSAFNEFKAYKLRDTGEELARAKVFMGKSGDVGVALAAPIIQGLHISQREQVKSRVEYKTPVAPIVKGDQIAELVVSVKGQEDMRYALFATEDVKAKSLFGKAWASLIGKIRGEL
ncbi:MAG: D-alanyl-D-alanine carboxypeptidase family protein [Litorimonas sp.]